MKNIYKTKLIILFTLLTNVIFSQDFNDFTINLKKDKVEQLYAQLDSDIEISILNQESFTKREAKELLYEFLEDNDNIVYKPIHAGAVQGNAYYQIGQLKSKENLFRTYLYLKNANGIFLIQEFRIEKI